MCDYSLHNVKSRPAKVGDQLTTRHFGRGTRGFAAPEDSSVAVCVLPGTELSLADKVTCIPTGLLAWRGKVINHKTAIFRQINKERAMAHHDALEFPDGQTVLLTFLCEGQKATVLQLPVEAMTAAEKDFQKRVTFVGLNSSGQTCLRPPDEAATFFHAQETRKRKAAHGGAAKDTPRKSVCLGLTEWSRGFLESLGEAARDLARRFRQEFLPGGQRANQQVTCREPCRDCQAISDSVNRRQTRLGGMSM